MRLIDVKKKNLEQFFGDEIPPYAILSHTWGADEDEILYQDFERGNLKKIGPKIIKFESCCRQALEDGLRYAWIDTCCIQRSDSNDLGEVINSMFRWYKNAAICYAYLADVPAGVDCSDPNSEFFTSRWFTRGWTLQELLAPETVCFYDQDWNFLGTKAEMSVAIETITGIPRPVLQGWASLDKHSVAQRMSWASKRVTKRPEDIAYCLLGVFGVYLSMIYGEGAEEAFGRLQQKIMTELRDESIMAWGLNVVEPPAKGVHPVLSAGVLARSPSDFANCRNIVSRKRYAGPIHSLEISGGCLSVQLPLHIEPNGEIYGVLSCGPEDADDDVVMIPLYEVAADSSEYIRPKYHRVKLRNKKSLIGSPKLIYIQKHRASGKRQLANRRHWFYVENLTSNLELIDVQPRSRWQKDSDMIATTNESRSDVTERSLTRFRAKERGCSDIVIILEFTLSKTQAYSRFHVMTCSTSTSLEDFGWKLQYMRQQVFEKQVASNGRLNVEATMTEKSIAGDPMFVLRLATAEALSVPTADATLELSRVELMLGFIKTLQQQQTTGQEEDALHETRSGFTTNLNRQRRQLKIIKEQIRSLVDEKDELERVIRAGNSLLNQEKAEVMRLKKYQEVLENSKWDHLTRLRDLLGKDVDANSGPGQWIEAVAEMLVNSSDIKIDLDEDDVVKLGGGSSQTTAEAAENSYNVCGNTRPNWNKKNRQTIIKLLLDESATIVPEDWEGTALGWTAANGLKSVVCLHLEMQQTRKLSTGSKQKFPLSNHSLDTKHTYKSSPASVGTWESDGIDKTDKSGRTALSYAAAGGHEDIVKMLLDGGASIDSKDRDSRTPLTHALMSGNEAVVKLLDRGAGQRLADQASYMPKHLAIVKGRQTIIADDVSSNADRRDSKTGLDLAFLDNVIMGKPRRKARDS